MKNCAPQLMASEKDKMLELLKLDVNYEDGKDDWLFYTEQDQRIKVLDLCGSYGVNLLGHKNEVYQHYQKAINSLRPNFIQNSIGPERQKLAYRLAERLNQQTGKGNWNCEFANSGSEIIESALKLSLYHYETQIEEIKQNLYYSLNSLNISGAKKELIDKVKKSLAEFESLKPKALYFEGSYHGKTFGSLSLMSNSIFKKQLPQALENIACPTNAEEFLKCVYRLKMEYYLLHPKTGKLINKTFLPLCGIFLEPIQGEAGVHSLNNKLLSSISEIQQKHKVTIVSDEIQCGCYRTGHFSALHSDTLIADIYCFGKALGAGLAKISALCCNEDIYSKFFFQRHSSTFAGDEHSCKIGNWFLDTIDANAQKIEKLQSNWIIKGLEELTELYPEIIKAIRGKGNMIAIEFQESSINQSYITKFFKDLNQLGYWVSSVLLNREKLRIFPTLSSPLSFRIQPSIEFSDSELQFTLRALHSFLNALREHDTKYLFGHLFPVREDNFKHPFPKNVAENRMLEKAAVFICHPIDYHHARDILNLKHSFSDELMNPTLEKLSDFQDFTIYHTDELVNSEGDKLNVVFLGIPLTSNTFYQALKSGKRKDWIQKIQKAVDYANMHHAKSIGLGQFTSIISGNGLYLNSPKVPITTGNAYTASLTVKAIRSALREQDLKAEDCKLSIIGAAGNILSVISEILIKEFQNVNLVFRTDWKESVKTRKEIIDFLKLCLAAKEDFPLKLVLQSLVKHYSFENQLESILQGIKEYLSINSDIKSVSQSKVIIIGTNSTSSILDSQHVQESAIIADIAVPSNTSKALQNRSDIIFIKGGIAALPLLPFGQEQELNSVILPFGSGECYACMAETFGIAFDAKWNQHNIGDLNGDLVSSIDRSLNKSGFDLKRIKVEDSL